MAYVKAAILCEYTNKHASKNNTEVQTPEPDGWRSDNDTIWAKNKNPLVSVQYVDPVVY